MKVSTTGNDGFYIDKLELYKDWKMVKRHGENNGKVWCLSTDPGDANRIWKGKIANGCQASIKFVFKK